MGTISKTDMTIFPRLYSVLVRGFKPEADDLSGHPDIDAPGSANWFVAHAVGIVGDHEDLDSDCDRIIWTDYDHEEWGFAALVTEQGLKAVETAATEHGYGFVRVRKIEEPENFGDGAGCVTILGHPDGWVIAS